MEIWLNCSKKASEVIFDPLVNFLLISVNFLVSRTWKKNPMRDALNPFIFAEKKGNAGPFILDLEQ